MLWASPSLESLLMEPSLDLGQLDKTKYVMAVTGFYILCKLMKEENGSFEINV